MTREISFREAINMTLRDYLRREPRAYLIGEDIGELGGAFRVTKGLLEEFGEDRILDTPISEAAILGAALGSALTGLYPIAEIMFCDFLYSGMDQLANQIAKLRYMSGGQASLPLVIRTTVGAGLSAAAQHSQSLEALVAHVGGIKVAFPSSPADAAGLLKTALAERNPVMFLEHKRLYPTRGYVSEDVPSVPFGDARIVRTGDDVTIVASGAMMIPALEAADHWAEQGVASDVIDLRSIVPLDHEKVLSSARKTGRVVVVQEAGSVCSVASEILALVAETNSDTKPIHCRRVCAPSRPIPFSPPLEQKTIPGTEDVVAAIGSIMESGSVSP